jgi:glycosyltransferase involved in cell wall biosynthesis
VVTDGVEGYLIEPLNVEAMAERALEVLSDETRRREMGKRGRESARRRFCTSKIIPQYEAYYRRILAAT